MTTRYVLMLTISTALALAACGESDPVVPDAAGGADAGSGSDSGSAGTDASAALDGGVGRPPLHDCREADFVDLTAAPADGRMIMVPRGTFMFDQPCITVRSGQSVMFMWDFTTHPLRGGVAPAHPGTGSEPNPIVDQSTGVLYEQAFAAAGDFPFYCEVHFHSGMMGVVRVIP